MEIGYVGQYNKNAAQTVGTPVPQAAVTSLTASVRELKPGSIFEGNVAYIKGSNVILSLENGQNIRARLDNHALKLVQGQSMFFQVKANENGMVSIRPYMGGGEANPTITRALDAAGLPVDARNIEMVKSMMKEQLPIHADALMEMHRTILTGGNARVDTLVQMAKLDLPITPQMAAQFENYKNDTHMLLGQMSEFMEQLPEFLESQSASVRGMVQMNAQLVEILTDGLPKEPVTMPQGQPAAEAAMTAEEAQEETARTALPGAAAAAEGSLEGIFLSELADGDFDAGKPAFAPNQIGAVLSPELREDFADVLRSTGNLVENEAVFDENGRLNDNLTARGLLTMINRELLSHQESLEQDDVKDIFSHKGYQKLLSHVMEEQWLVQPQDLKTKDKLGELYSRLNRQMEQIDKILKATGNDHTPLARGAEQIRSNMEFMNEVNHIYNYVQIPLKLSGQNANGDLYVYTNKKKPREKDGELTAFLHLDMDHLGSTDVFVKMRGKALDTNFSFSDDESFALVQKYLPILDAKLAALGYNSTITVNNEEKKPDFVEDFLMKDLPGGTSGGVVHRYSFDVRA